MSEEHNHDAAHGEEGHVHDDHCIVKDAPLSNEHKMRPTKFTDQQLQDMHDDNVANDVAGTTATDGKGTPGVPA